MRKVSPRYGPGQRWRSGTVESDAGPVDGPDAWDGYRAAVVSQAVLASMSRGGPARVESIEICAGKSTGKNRKLTLR
jgi:hypothetical protein